MMDPAALGLPGSGIPSEPGWLMFDPIAATPGTRYTLSTRGYVWLNVGGEVRKVLMAGVFHPTHVRVKLANDFELHSVTIGALEYLLCPIPCRFLASPLSAVVLGLVRPFDEVRVSLVARRDAPLDLKISGWYYYNPAN